MVFLTLWFTAAAGALPAPVLVQPAERADWQLHGSAFYCRMQQEVRGFGQVSFLVEPGYSLRLELELIQPHQALTEASVMARPADWQQRIVATSSYPYSAELYHDRQVSFIAAALPLLQQIQSGHWLEFELGAPGQVQPLLLTSVRGAEAVAQFRRCIAQMAPLSWQQARDSDIPFEAGQRTLTRPQLVQLAQLVRYLQFDPSVHKILIDGHSDDVGTSLANRLVSKERADEVAAQLIELGVKAAMLEVRAHGNRYPLLHHQGTSGATNSRVTVRLIRAGTEQEVTTR